jgi:hypothetical protein
LLFLFFVTPPYILLPSFPSYILEWAIFCYIGAS